LPSSSGERLASGQPILSLEEYFAYLGISPTRIQDGVCEICSHASFTPLRGSVAVGNGLRVRLAVVSCDRCGYLYQNPRFDPEFYNAYYNAVYRHVLTGSLSPTPDFIEDQLARGEHLFSNLRSYLPGPGRLLDVGCSSGGVMQAFLKRGWTGIGTDPDRGYVEFGRRELNAPIKVERAEDMVLEQGVIDLVLITGSLEHVFDPNRVLALCHRACADGALLLIEGRGLGQSRQIGSCGHNHRRFLTATSIDLFMRKHGWDPLWITDEELSGPTRPHSTFGIGRIGHPLSPDDLAARIAKGACDWAGRHRADFATWNIG
jgi:SAM-dependent methyltransferase